MKIIGALLMVLGCLCANAHAQLSGATTASMAGVVRDDQDNVIAAARVAIQQQLTNITLETATGNDGAFLFSQIAPGPYKITVTAEGFAPKTVQTTLVLGITGLLNIKLSLEQVAEEVIVVKDEEGLTERATNIRERNIDNLPINQRTFLDFTLTTPGASRDGVPTSGSIISSGIAFHGQPARQNNITIDGLDNNNPVAGQARATFSQEAVQEFQVVAANFSAEFGRALGGIINIVTKSGTNELHGELFQFLRNEELSARNTFSPIDPEFKQFQFGATLSGPIQKEKSFFFTSFERLSVKQNSIVTIDDQTIAAVRRRGFDASNGPVPFARAATQLLARADFQLATNNQLTVRYNYGGEYEGAIQPFSGLRAESSGGTRLLRDNTFGAINRAFSTSANLVNEARFLYGRRDQQLFALDTRFGPQLTITTPRGQSFFGLDPLLPQMTQSRFYQVVDIVSLVRGRHQIKAGFDFFFFRVPDNETSIPVLFGGNAVYTPLNFNVPGVEPFSALQLLDPSLRTPAQQNFLAVLAMLLPRQTPGLPANLPLTQLSIPVAYLQGFGNPLSGQTYDYYSAFVQDDFRARPNLLIKVGLRYDQERAGFAPKNRGSISPRLGLSYKPGNSEKLDLRFAYGLFHSTLPTSALTVSNVLDGKKAFIAVLPFPFSIIPSTLPTQRFTGTGLPAGVPLIPQLGRIVEVDQGVENPYAQHANVGFNYFFSPTVGIAATYQFVRGLKLFSPRQINPIVRPVPGNPIQSAITGRVDARRGEIFQYVTDGDTYYNGATVSLTVRQSNVQLLAQYTYAKTIDNFIDLLRTDLAELQNPLDPSAERGLSLQDLRHRLVLSGLIDFSGARSRFIKGWQLSSITTIQSGRPFNLLAGVDLDRNGDTPAADRPNRIGRNAGIAPDFASVDLRLSRVFDIGERRKIGGYFEVFNLFNRVNISNLNRIYGPRADGSFDLPRQENGRFIATPDRFTAAFDPRQIQIGLRFSF